VLKHKFQSVGKRYAPSWSVLYWDSTAFILHTRTDPFYCSDGYAKMNYLNFGRFWYYIVWQNITQRYYSNITHPAPANLKEASAVGMMAEIGK